MTLAQSKVFNFQLLVAVLLLLSCTVKNIPGNYYSNKKPYSLILDSNQAYYYRYKFQVEYSYSTGTWIKMTSKKIALQSDIKNKTIPFEVKNLNDASITKDALNIFVVDVNIPDEERQHYNCSIYTNDSLLLKQKSTNQN